jgi:hypothetical protein
MATLIHEVWEDLDDDGQILSSVCLAGPDGDGFRALLSSNARRVATFSASCHYEAMTKYYAMYGRGDYTTDQAWDYEPYPEEWAVVQQRNAPTS